MDSLGEIIIANLENEASCQMSGKLLYKVTLKTYNQEKVDKYQSKIIFQNSLDDLLEKNHVYIDHKDVVHLVTKKKRKFEAIDASHPEPNSASVDNNIIGAILNFLRQTGFDSDVSKKKLRKYTFQQLTYVTSITEDDKIAFKQALKQLISDEVVKMGDEGIRLVGNGAKVATIKIESEVIRDLKERKWSEEESAKLLELVPLHEKMHSGRLCTDWTTIGKLMNRDRKQCEGRYRRIFKEKDLTLVIGPFTLEEDEIIREHVEIFGDEKSPDLWLVLSCELNRDIGRVRERWSVIRKSEGKLHREYWTDELDKRLLEAYELYGSDWKSVADYVGTDHVGRVCGRWRDYLCPEQMNRNLKPWTNEEISFLHTLVPKYTCDTKRGIIISWVELSRELNRRHVDCNHKWNLICASKMKKGPFTKDECDLIKQRVQEWGNKGNGLWTALESELGRAGKFINAKWTKKLRHDVVNDDVAFL